MSTFLGIRDGGKTNEEGFQRFMRRSSNNGQGIMLSTDMSVIQHGGGNMSVDINVSSGTLTGADLVIAYQNYLYYTWIDAVTNLSISAADPTNPRIDAIVAYVDLSVVSSSSNNNPGALKFMDVTGTPAGSPSAPNNTAIQSAVGAGNPFYELATVRVNAGASSIVTANITKIATQFLLGSAAKFGFSIPGTPGVANDLSWDPTVPAAQTVTTLYAYCKTAPTGSGVTIRIYNVTQNLAVASVTIAAAANAASTTSMTNASLNAGDVLRADITAQGSTTPAADISAVLF